MDLKELLGEDLYNQVKEKAGDNKLAIVNDGNWLPKDKFDEKNNEVKSLKEQLSDRDTQLEDLRGKAQGNEEMQTTIDALKEANSQAKEAHEQQLNEIKFGYELDRALLNEKARNPRAVKALLDTDTIKLDEEGQLIGLNEQLEGLKESDDYLFASDAEGSNYSQTNYTPGGDKKTNKKPPIDYSQAGVTAFESLKEKGKI